MTNGELVMNGLREILKREDKLSNEGKEFAYMILNDSDGKYLIGFLQLTEFICLLSPNILDVIQQKAKIVNLMMAMIKGDDNE